MAKSAHQATKNVGPGSNTQTAQGELSEQGPEPIPRQMLRDALKIPGATSVNAARELNRLVGNRATTKMIAESRRTPTGAGHRAPIQAKLSTSGGAVEAQSPTSLEGGAQGGRSSMPDALRTNMERSFGASFADVTIHTNSPKAAGRGALAVTEGSRIDFAPGQFQPDTGKGRELIGHELTHVLQQRSRRRAGLMQPKSTRGPKEKALDIDYDTDAERQADACGQRAARGERAIVPGAPSEPSPAGASGGAPIQPKLGFELEMLILVDKAGRGIPEKTVIGQYGTGLSIDVDQGKEVAAITPALPEASNFDISSGRYTGKYSFEGVDDDYEGATFDDMMQNDNFWDDLKEHQLKDVVTGLILTVRRVLNREYSRDSARSGQDFPELFDMVNNKIDELQQNAFQANGNDVNSAGYKQAYWDACNPELPATVDDVLDAVDTALQDNANRQVKGDFVQANLDTTFEDTLNANTEVTSRTATGQPGMGLNRYASILELVTNAYDPETGEGKRKLWNAIKDAQEFADLIEGQDPRSNRVRLNTLSPKLKNVAGDVYIGNKRSKRQTTDASIQSTFGLDLAQLASFIKSTATMGSQDFFRTKHNADNGGIYRTEAELRAAVKDATDIINEFNAPENLPNLRGLLILLIQYLRLGKFAQTNGTWVLDKNLTSLLSRTDLSRIRLGMPVAEQTWLDTNKAQVKAKILTKTGRLANSTVLTDATQNQAYPHNAVTVGQLIDNTFEQNADGMTSRFGGFKQMNEEQIHPHNSLQEAAPKQGPVFELRNLIPAKGDNERFPRSTWLNLARALANIIGTLHERTDEDAMKDTLVKVRGVQDQNRPGALKGKQDDAQSWKR